MFDVRLEGRLLVATPLIGGSIFERAVILLVEYNDEGALGVILNQPSEVPVVELLPGWSESGDVVYQGGPVGEESALAIAYVEREPENLPGMKRISADFALVDLDGNPAELNHVLGMRTFVGYAGWSAGQLEEELEEGSWFVMDALGEDLLAPSLSLYQAVLRRAGGVMALHSTYLADPSLN